MAIAGALLEPIAVEDRVGEVAGKQLVEHRGLARGVVGQRVPVERVEEVLTPCDIACQPGNLGTGGGDGEIDVHVRFPVRR
ncbi:hypothetical protein ACWGNZ_23190 (plasmid) [Sphingomonas zeae]|jgi:hypothetical protein